MKPIPTHEIPDLYHFIWIGSRKPDFLAIAIQSVLSRCPGASVILWTDQITSEDAIKDLERSGRFSQRAVQLEQLISKLGMESIEKLFMQTFEQAGTDSTNFKTNPIERSKSNLIRYIILYIHGGIYLDADTLVLKDLTSLRQGSSGFLGRENTVWPITKRSNPLHRFIWAPFLEVFRFVACQLPFGYRLNGAYRVLCSSAENNAVLGFSPRHPYLKAALDSIAGMPMEEIVRPLRLGPYLLQRVSAQYHEHDLVTYDERYFYPYGPLISRHFFTKRKNAGRVASKMISRETHVLHWGASTKYLKDYTTEKLRLQKDESVFTLLANETMDAYESRNH